MNDLSHVPADYKSLYIRLWRHISNQKKRQLSGLIILTVAASFSEMLAVGSLIPLVTVLSQPETLFEIDLMLQLARVLSIADPKELVTPLLAIFAGMMIAASALRIFLTWFQTRFSNTTGSEIASDVFLKTLVQPYSAHLQRNSSQIISALTVKTNQVVGGILTPLTAIFTQLCLAVAICGALLFINPFIVLYGTLFLCFAYLAVLMVVKPKLLLNSVRISQGSTSIVKIVQEGLGGIRDLIIDGYLDRAGAHYATVDLKTRLAQADSHVLSLVPRYIVETIGVLSFLFLATYLSEIGGGLENSLPTLAAFAVGLQRLLPIMQQIYASFATVLACNASLFDVVQLLEQELPERNSNNELTNHHNEFSSSICLNAVSFKYPKAERESLSEVNLEVCKGEKIGLVGPSGSGKSTLLDLLMGLISPSEGELIIDRVGVSKGSITNWQQRISHVPQAVYLADSSIAENIAFGLDGDAIDYARIEAILHKLDLWEYVQALPLGVDTHVGEQGARMSGGQRQRLGVARAMYKRSEVLFLDEATSALDAKTESKVIESLIEHSAEMTIFAAAHRTETLAFCDRILVMEDGRISSEITYEQLLKRGITE